MQDMLQTPTLTYERVVAQDSAPTRRADELASDLTVLAGNLTIGERRRPAVQQVEPDCQQASGDRGRRRPLVQAQRRDQAQRPDDPHDEAKERAVIQRWRLERLLKLG